MASLTIELSAEAYARLQQEAQRQGKEAHLLAQELLLGQLGSATRDETPLYVQFMPMARSLVATMAIETFNVPGTATPDEAAALVRSWGEEHPDDDDGDESWEDVLRSIDANRFSYRKLFPHLENPE